MIINECIIALLKSGELRIKTENQFEEIVLFLSDNCILWTNHY